MAEQSEHVEAVAAGDDDDDADLPYKAPAPKSIDEILTTDKDDESLIKYKEKLLKGAEKVVIDPNNPNNVILKKLVIVVEGRPEIELDLTMSLEEIKKKRIVLKEGTKYRVKIMFYVQREIVAGLRYSQKVYRKGIRVDKGNHMVGSYPPNKEPIAYLTQEEEAPEGLLSRGDYKVESCFVDDDNHKYLEWVWHLTISKDWEC